MTPKEDTVRRRDIVLRYLGGKGNGWVPVLLIESDTLVTVRALNTIMNWMENHDLVRVRDTKGQVQCQLTAFGREIYNIRQEAVRPVEATA